MLASLGLGGLAPLPFLAAALFVAALMVVVLIAWFIGSFTKVVDRPSLGNPDGELRWTPQLTRAKSISIILFVVGGVALLISLLHGCTLEPTWLNRNSGELGYTGLAYFLTAVALRSVVRKMARSAWDMREKASWGVFLTSGILASSLWTLYWPVFRPERWLDVDGLEYGSMLILILGFTVAVLARSFYVIFRRTDRSTLPRIAGGILIALAFLDAVLWAVFAASLNRVNLCSNPNSPICRLIVRPVYAIFEWVF